MEKPISHKHATILWIAIVLACITVALMGAAVHHWHDVLGDSAIESQW
jgi:hypothetical protein